MRAARAQLRQVASDVLDQALHRLEGRPSGKSKKGEVSAGSRAKTLDRMREVLERDRAVVVSTLNAAASPALAPTPLPVEPPATVWEEPIRTRTLAKLLAMQGYQERALGMYEWLLVQEPDDELLRGEISRLRGARG